MAHQVYLAVDLGASSGRVLAGVFDGQRLRLEEVHRFENGPVQVGGTLHWDVLRLWQEIQAGLRQAATQYRGQIVSVGVDTWGVDFALLGRGDVLLGNPVHYRDRRTDGVMERAFRRVPRSEIFAATGLQFMQFNTLFQLIAMTEQNSPLLEVAESLLLMPDMFHWLLTGRKANELTNATTTQFYNPITGRWATELFERFELPQRLLGELVQPGTRLGKLAGHVAAATDLPNVEVVLPGTHDTASAVMAVPAADPTAERPTWAYISSGTWALAGVETPRAVVNDACAAMNFTNEGGVGGTNRLLKNITGLWLVQECRRAWAQAGTSYEWGALVKMAAAAPPRVSLVDPDAPDFLAPRDMPQAIAEYCRRTGQTVPDGPGAMIRCALESIALKSRRVLEQATQLSGAQLAVIHIVGGGVQNRELCQATADACGRRVLAGPVEATATGNVLVQAMAAGAVGSIAEARDVVRRSFAPEEYSPRQSAAWDEAYGRFEQLLP
ncbi:MAG: rhamnulokinase [Pirellulales bacterium]|nr:rhamnulokinase [Pirellulales bacterium]